MAVIEPTPPATVASRPGLRGSSVTVGTGLLLWSLGNFVFFLIAGRSLGTADYGLAAAILAGTLILGIPFTGLQPALIGSNAGGDADPLYRRALHRASVVSSVALILYTLALTAVGQWTTLSIGPLLVAGTIVMPGVVFPLTLARLQIAFEFRKFSYSLIAGGAARPLMLIILLNAGFHLYAALLGTAIAAAVSLAIALWFTRQAISRPSIDRLSDSWGRYKRALAPAMTGLGAFAFLTNADVIASRLVLSPHDSGLFAAAAVLSKALFLVPQALATALMPSVARMAPGASTSGRLLARAAVLSTIAVGGASVACVPLGRTILRVTFGPDYERAGDDLPLFVLTMGAMGIVFLLVNHQMARGHATFAYALSGVAVIQGGLLLIAGRSVGTILMIDALCFVLAVASYEVVHRSDGESMRRAFGRKKDGSPQSL